MTSPVLIKFRIPLVTTLSCLSLLSGAAVAAPDPFNLDLQVPPHPGSGLEGRTSPCQLPAEQTLLGLAEVVDQSLCNNPRTREAWANARVQAGLTGVSQAAYLPSLNAVASSSRKRTDIGTNSQSVTQNTASLSLSYLLYDFGGREANLENSRQLLNAAISTQDATRQAVFLSALQAFYQVHATDAAVQAAWESERAAQESFKAAEARYLAGTATPADKLQAQTAYSQAMLTRIKAEGSLKNAQGTLANVMGLEAQRPVRLAPIQAAFPEQRFERDLDTLVAEARRNRPDLQSAEARFQAAQASIAAARADGMPALSVAAGPGYQSIDGVSSRTGSIGLTLNIPLFTGFANSYQIRAAEARAEASAAQRQQLAQQVALEVWQSYQNLLTATQTLRTTADLLASAEASERVARGRYQAGVGNILDLLNAQSALASARLQRVQSAFDWHVSRAALAQAMGVLDQRLLDSPAVFDATAVTASPRTAP